MRNKIYNTGMALAEILTESSDIDLNEKVTRAVELITSIALGGTVEVYTFQSQTQGHTPIDYLLKITAVQRKDHAEKHDLILRALNQLFPELKFSILPKFITDDEELSMVSTPRPDDNANSEPSTIDEAIKLLKNS